MTNRERLATHAASVLALLADPHADFSLGTLTAADLHEVASFVLAETQDPGPLPPTTAAAAVAAAVLSEVGTSDAAFSFGADELRLLASFVLRGAAT